MDELSPAAQAVMNAFSIQTGTQSRFQRVAAAAILRTISKTLGHEVLRVRCVDCSQMELIADELDPPTVDYAIHDNDLFDR